jgi:rfaE bifunctional protein nucleotidyltransferase chain/domain
MQEGVKILPLEVLSGLLEEYRSAGKTIVHCHGVFDLLHVGHLRHLSQAKSLGDVLVVTVTPDEFVNKGPHRPAFPHALRAEVLAALTCVDFVAVNRWPTAAETIRLLRPHLFVKGSEYRRAEEDRTGGIALEEEAVRSVGGRIAFTDDIVFSSTTLLNRYFSPFGDRVAEYLDAFKGRYPLQEVESCLKAVRQNRFLVVGQGVLVENHRCLWEGGVRGEACFRGECLSGRKDLAGAAAAANHLAGLSDRVSLLLGTGGSPGVEDAVDRWVRPSLRAAWTPLRSEEGLYTQRFSGENSPQCLLEVSERMSSPRETGGADGLLGILEARRTVQEFTVLIDYDTRFGGPEVLEKLCERGRVITANPRVSCWKRWNGEIPYPHADSIHLQEEVLQAHSRSPRGSVEENLLRLVDRLGCRHATVDRQEAGFLFWGREEGFLEVPRLSEMTGRWEERTDVFFPVLAACLSLGQALEMVGFLVSLLDATAAATAFPKPLEEVSLLRSIESLMK